MATRVTKHASPALLARGVRGVAGEPMEIVLHLPTSPALSAQGFGQGSAFPGAELAAGAQAMAIAAQQRPEARLLLFAHADEKGDEVYNKRLSDLRASATFALLTQDLAKLDQVAEDDQWGTAQYQGMLDALGIGPIAADGQAGLETASTLRRFQQAYNRGAFHSRSLRTRAYSELRVDGLLGPRTQSALRDAYLATVTCQLAPGRFIGPKMAGCGEFNRTGTPERDRRVSLALYRPNFPTESKIPCKDGDVASCKINRKAHHSFKCNFYRRTLECETPVGIQPATEQSGTLLSVFARDQLVNIIGESTHDSFRYWLVSVFGRDITEARYEDLYQQLKNESLPHPPIVLLSGGPLRGRSGAYNRRTQCIEISARLAWNAAMGDAEASWLLVAVLVEEFGHYLDDWLREGRGDAEQDEGARFGWTIVNLDKYQKTTSEFAVFIDNKGNEFPISVDFSQLRGELNNVFSLEAQYSDERDDVREYFGPAVTAERICAAAQLAMGQSAKERVDKMTAIGAAFGMPVGAWPTGQSRVFVGHDVRVAALLRRLMKESASKAAAINLDRAQRHTSVDPYLVLTTAARENDGSITALGTTMINTYWEGGLDFLWTNKNKLGLPRSITDQWAAAPVFINAESGKEVHPGLIPAKDQVLGYAVQTKLSFENWQKYVKRALGDGPGQAALSALTAESRAIWQAYAFVSPGGSFDPSVGPVHGQGFGVNAGFRYLVDKAAKAGREVDLNEVVSDSSMERTDYVRIAKARAIEAAFIADYVTLAAAISTGSPAVP